MLLALRFILFWIVCAPALHCEALAGGTSSSGPGSFVLKKDGSAVLLDVATDQKRQNPERSAPSVEFSQTAFLKTVGYERIGFDQLPDSALLVRRLKKWRKASPHSVVVGEMEDALRSMNFLYVDRKFKTLDSYYLPASSGVDRRNIRTGIVYEPTIGAIISGPTFILADAQSRSAALGHEALRHVQKFYGISMSDHSLQSIISTLFLRDPKPGESLDDKSLIDGDLLKLIQERRREQETYIDAYHDFKTDWQNKIAPPLRRAASRLKSAPIRAGVSQVTDAIKNCDVPEDTKIQDVSLTFSTLIRDLRQLYIDSPDPDVKDLIFEAMKKSQNAMDSVTRLGIEQNTNGFREAKFGLDSISARIEEDQIRHALNIGQPFALGPNVQRLQKQIDQYVAP